MKRIFAFEEDGKLKQYEGCYTDYSFGKLAEKEVDVFGRSGSQNCCTVKRVVKCKILFL